MAEAILAPEDLIIEDVGGSSEDTVGNGCGGVGGVDDGGIRAGRQDGGGVVPGPGKTVPDDGGISNVLLLGPALGHEIVDKASRVARGGRLCGRDDGQCGGRGIGGPVFGGESDGKIVEDGQAPEFGTAVVLAADVALCGRDTAGFGKDGHDIERTIGDGGVEVPGEVFKAGAGEIGKGREG